MAEGGIQWVRRIESGAYRCHHPGVDVLRIILPAVFCLTLMPACSNLGGPDYQRPEVTSKAGWSEDADAGVSAEAVIQPGWWTGFGDPYLNELISRAISDNVDIRIFAARSGVAKAAIGQAKAGLLPTISGGTGTDTLKS
ncbi:MAG: hypothetical protein U9P00_11230, partial [Pseudomonadota bacterium]|nr:hypothetical protein [Pseudomonadota bacterium]